MIVYDDHVCKIEIVPSTSFAGAYYIILDGDDENCQTALGQDEALDTADAMREAFEEEHGQFGVGS